MIRTGLWSALVVGSALAMTLVPAIGGPPENEDARYTFHRADDGYLRLDGHSGEVSLCTRKPVGWLCQALPDERAALEAELSRLHSDNATLKRELLLHNLALPAGIRPDSEPPKAQDTARPQPRNEARVKEVIGYIQNVWRRLVEMIANVQRDILRKT
jgi:hypothetical protein